jgi:DNA-binding response OmpR family regulator
MTNTRVLILEDDPDFQLSMRTQLRMKQFAISCAVDGIQLSAWHGRESLM